MDWQEETSCFVLIEIYKEDRELYMLKSEDRERQREKREGAATERSERETTKIKTRL